MMTASSIARRFPRSPPPRSETHLYAVGEAVRLKRAPWKSGDVYHVTARLPPIGDMPQYRIRSDDERFERVARQDDLEHVVASDGATLVEKAFGLVPTT
jgi:hypothetical protein